MPSTHKKVVVRKMDRDSINGHVAPANFVREGKLELLNTSGNVVAIDLKEIKAVYFVREFGDSESLSRKTFTSRPRTEGLWVRLKFKDNEVLEGMMPNDLSLTTAEDAENRKGRALRSATLLDCPCVSSSLLADGWRPRRFRTRCWRECWRCSCPPRCLPHLPGLRARSSR